MTTGDCARMEFLLQADIDGQLDIGDAAGLAAHLIQCASCREKQAALGKLSKELRAESPYHVAPARLRRALEAQVLDLPKRENRVWFRFAVPVCAGAAFAFAVAFALIPGRAEEMSDSVVASHIRALQPGHLVDVVSTDRHTVKPWFDGKLDYAPPVKDLAPQGFPLTGGRLDYLAGRPVAALDYRRAKHDIDFYVWPSSNSVSQSSGTYNGYHFVHWSQDNMVFWVVSDLNPAELDDFVKLWRSAS